MKLVWNEVSCFSGGLLIRQLGWQKCRNFVPICYCSLRSAESFIEGIASLIAEIVCAVINSAAADFRSIREGVPREGKKKRGHLLRIKYMRDIRHYCERPSASDKRHGKVTRRSLFFNKTIQDQWLILDVNYIHFNVCISVIYNVLYKNSSDIIIKLYDTIITLYFSENCNQISTWFLHIVKLSL